ncbi:hypothetical protein DM860_007523 [Cuscuta australis]|uniref:Uncharacterized protein n=1 Tax=Cuscuta australis TaxID=267555 RepID=A0A328E490_9ASTE|nr:hypothetical protein DM860_007523 [Cuscuta australis]
MDAKPKQNLKLIDQLLKIYVCVCAHTHTHTFNCLSITPISSQLDNCFFEPQHIFIHQPKSNNLQTECSDKLITKTKHFLNRSSSFEFETNKMFNIKPYTSNAFLSLDNFVLVYELVSNPPITPRIMEHDFLRLRVRSQEQKLS